MRANKAHWASRAATSGLRIAPRIFPIPGWFPIVAERLHPTAAGDLEVVEVVTHGVRMRLDLRDYIQRRIFYESHEPHELGFCARFLRPGDVAVDVGAHVGIFTLIAASIVGARGMVHAFEPVPTNFASLAENVRLNGFENVVLNPAAVGGNQGEVSIGLPEVVPDSGPTSAMYTAGGPRRSVTTPMVALDDYIDEHIGQRSIRLVKIDAEGFEPAVLAGLERRLQIAPPDAILLELNIELLDRHGFHGQQILWQLKEAGYRVLRTTPFGRLREFDGDLPTSFDRERDVPNQASGLRGWLRRYRAESRIFLNLFAVQRPGPQSANGVK